jgi:hypothetical protein
MTSAVARASSTDPVHVGVILGGLYGPDGYAVSRGMLVLAGALERMPGVQVRV